MTLSQIPGAAQGYRGWSIVRAQTLALLARARTDLSLWADVRAFPPLAVWCGLNCVGLMILVRRVSPGPALKLAAWQVGVVATFAALLAIASRALLSRVESRAPSLWLRCLAGGASTVPLWVLLISSGATLGVLASVYMLLLIAAAGAAGFFWNRRLTDQMLAAALSHEFHEKHSTRHARLREEALALPVVPFQTAPNGNRNPQTVMCFERTSDPHEGERIQGIAIGQFAIGQGTAAVHIAFCPPLPVAPEVNCELPKDSPVRLKLTATYAWGCRLELKRSGDLTQPDNVEIRFSATNATSAARRAA